MPNELTDNPPSTLIRSIVVLMKDLTKSHFNDQYGSQGNKWRQIDFRKPRWRKRTRVGQDQIIMAIGLKPDIQRRIHYDRKETF